MASPASMKAMEDKFFECPICLDNFKEPKLLPCVHRICRACLKGIIEEHQGEFNCPLCHELCNIPPEGVDGFRTDFHMKSMLQYIQLQQTAKTEELATECAGCSKVTYYCFKCKGFLCEQCSTIHLTMKMMQEHKASVLSLKEIREQKLTLGRLASLKETPRCHGHIEKAAEVCCGTCRNLPVCIVCAHHGEHKGHDLHDVRLLAREERLKIEKSLETLEQYKDNIEQLPVRVKKVEERLNEDISAKKQKLQTQYTLLTEKIERHLRDVEELLKMNKADIDDLETQKVADFEEKRKKEIAAAVKLINDKYDQLIKEDRVKNQEMREEQEVLYVHERTRIRQGLDIIDKEFNNLNSSVDEQGSQNLEEVGKIFSQSTNRKSRFDNLRSTASRVLASNDNWVEAQLLPDISEASDSLIRDAKEEFSDLESRGQVTVVDLSAVTVVSITDKPESVNDITGLKAHSWSVTRMASTHTGNIVITGAVDDEHSHITVINKQGEIIQTDLINEEKALTNSEQPHSSCSPLPLFKVVKSSRNGEVALYNTQTRSYVKKHMSDITSTWGTCQLFSITADRIRKTVYIGVNHRKLFVSNDELSFSRTLKLSHDLNNVVDIAMHGTAVVVCDHTTGAGKVHIITTEGHEAELVSELPLPEHSGGKWTPWRVCTDSIGFICVVWHGTISGIQKFLLTQYSQDGHHLLATREVNGVVCGIDTLLTDGSEKLLLATSQGKLYTYGLMMKP